MEFLILNFVKASYKFIITIILTILFSSSIIILAQTKAPVVPDKNNYKQWETSPENVARFVKKSASIDYFVMETSDENGVEGPVVVYLHSKLGVTNPSTMLSWEWTINDLIWYFDLQGIRAKIIVPVCAHGNWSNKIQKVKQIIDGEKAIVVNRVC